MKASKLGLDWIRGEIQMCEKKWKNTPTWNGIAWKFKRNIPRLPSWIFTWRIKSVRVFWIFEWRSKLFPNLVFSNHWKIHEEYNILMGLHWQKTCACGIKWFFNGLKSNCWIGCWSCIQPFGGLNQIQLWKMICEPSTFGLHPKFKFC